MPTTDPRADFSELARTDPGFVDYFGDFAGREVVADAARLDERVDEHVRILIQAAGCLAAGGLTTFRALVAAGLSRGAVSPVEVKELIYQSVAYVGLARAVDYLQAVNDILIDREVALPLPDQSASSREARMAHGTEVQARIVGGVEAVHARLAGARDDAAHFERYLTANCFGDTVGRGGLDLGVRELITFAMLVALGGADAQVAGHVAGNLAVGNGRATLLAVLTLLTPYLGYPRVLNGLAAVNAQTAG